MAWTAIGSLQGPPGTSPTIPVPVAQGGTGATTAAAACAALGAALITGATTIAVVTSLPGTPDPNTVYFVKPA